MYCKVYYICDAKKQTERILKMSRNKLQLIGEKYGRLTVIADMGFSKYQQSQWRCDCSCGNTCVVLGNSLQSGATQSCGCLRIERVKQTQTTHGMTSSATYLTWIRMIQRCENHKNTYYKIYGGRVIKVCKRWRNSFINFFKDMGEKPKGKTLDRIDNDGNYYPHNCRWATRRTQQNNRRNTIYLTFKGKTHTLAQWSRYTKIKYVTLYTRIRHGWTIEDVLTTPILERKTKSQ